MGFVVCGIDPGINGAIILLDQHRNIISKTVMPYDKKIKELDVNTLYEYFDSNKNNIDFVFLEMATSRPLQSSRSTFTTGMNYGILRAVVSIFKLKLEIVHPSKWTKHIHDGFSKDMEPKDKAKLSAKRLFPKENFVLERCKIPHSGLIDAVLIAEYGLRKLNK